MRIALVVPTLVHGGAESMVVDLADGLASRGVAVTLVTITDWSAERFMARLSPAVERIALGARPYDLRGVSRFVALHRRARWDAAIHHLTPTLMHQAAVRATGARTPAVFVEHNGNPVPMRAGRAELARRALYRAFDHVVCVSSAMREGYVRRFCPASYDRSSVVHNGVDVAHLVATADATDAAAVRAEFGFDAGDRVVGVIGRLIPQKGHAAFFDALAARAHELRTLRVRVLVVGGGVLYDALTAQVRAVALDDLVRFAGPRDDVARVLAALDLVAMPSVWEGLPIALLEALAVGVPVVATDVGGIREVVDAGVGRLVPSDASAVVDGIVHLLRRPPAELRSLGQAGRHRAATRFALGTMTDRYLALVESLVAGGRRAPASDGGPARVASAGRER